MSLRRESRHLTRVFGALVLALAPAAAAQACSDAPAGLSPTSPDARDAPHDDDATTTDVAVDAPADAPTTLDAKCIAITQELEAGPDAASDADVRCRYTLPCGLPAGSAFEIRGCGFYRTDVEDGGDASLGCWVPEGDGCNADAYSPPASGSVSFECYDCFGAGGRRPRGLRRPKATRPRSGSRSLAGSYFAQMAHEEAASVHAFTRLHDELHGLGAPALLVRAAARSARDEIRHARMMTRCAQAHGTSVRAAHVRRPSPRALEAMARENAAEGCVRETYGALLMHWQATHANEPPLQRMFARIAADETRHAALSWEVARWADAQLDTRARARVSATRTRALRALEARLRSRTATSSAVDAQLGQPGRDEALALLTGMVAQLSLG